MVEAGTLCGQADVAKMAGANANTTAVAEAYTNVYILEAEGIISLETRFDWVTNYASVSTIGKEILREATAAYAACQVINYDQSGFSSRQEAWQMVNMLWAKYREVVGLILKDNKYKDFVLTGTGDIE